MRTLPKPNILVSNFLLAGSSAIELVFFLNLLSVASWPSISATTMSPLTTSLVYSKIAISPSKIPAFIIDSPETFKA